MTEIKSSYEKAMERFQDVNPDRSSLLQKETKEAGRVLCAQRLQGHTKDKNIVMILKKFSSDDEQEWFRDGIEDTLLAQIVLPANESAIINIATIKEIAIELSPQPAMIEQLLDQYQQICEQYLDAKNSFAEQIKAQYMQMKKQQGQSANAMEPQFLQAMQKKMKDIDEQFKPTIQKIKLNFHQLCKISLEK